jgi:hypothetical protein
MYDPVHNEEVNTSLAGMSGKITDSYTIIPQYKGNYPIKPIQFSILILSTDNIRQLIPQMQQCTYRPSPVDSKFKPNANKNTYAPTQSFNL